MFRGFQLSLNCQEHEAFLPTILWTFLLREIVPSSLTSQI